MLVIIPLVGLFIPPYDKWSTDFIKEILAKKKTIDLFNLRLYDCHIDVETSRRFDHAPRAKVQGDGSEAYLEVYTGSPWTHVVLSDVERMGNFQIERSYGQYLVPSSQMSESS